MGRTCSTKDKGQGAQTHHARGFFCKAGLGRTSGPAGAEESKRACGDARAATVSGWSVTVQLPALSNLILSLSPITSTKRNKSKDYFSSFPLLITPVTLKSIPFLITKESSMYLLYKI
jgi:hypothetical protein